jgi:hypothetical protein
MQRQKLVVTLNLRRRPMYFIFNVMTVLGMLTTMAFAVFRQTVLTSDYEGRAQTTLTLMLSSIAYKFFVADMVPRVSYLTVLDLYIYAGLVTCAAIFVLNTCTLCYSDTLDDCKDQTDIEFIGWITLVAFWSLANVFTFFKAGRCDGYRTHSLAHSLTHLLLACLPVVWTSHLLHTHPLTHPLTACLLCGHPIPFTLTRAIISR